MKLLASLLMAVLISCTANAQMHYTVSVDTPYFHVQLQHSGIKEDSLLFKMPAWTPVYYQLMHYAKEVHHFNAKDPKGHPLPWEKRGENGWMVYCKKNDAIVLEYDVRSTRPFVAANYLDKDRGYISPAGMFLHVSERIKQPVTIAVKPLPHWNMIASGMNKVKEDYKKEDRGFTAAEFRTVCENIAGVDLTGFFDYANTVKPLDYKKYFAYAGLEVTADLTLQPLAEPSALQALILKDWLR